MGYRFKFDKHKTNVMDSIKQEAYDKGYKAGYKAGELAVIETTFNLMAYTMSYKLGFGKKRLNRILHDIYNNIDSFRTGQLNAEDYEVICKELEDKGVTLGVIMKDID